MAFRITTTFSTDTAKSGFKNFPGLSKSRSTLSRLIWSVACIIAMFLSKTSAQNTGRCYTFGPGTTIPGADYRRDVGLSRRDCAEVCKTDACCLAFEWLETAEGIGMCTLKSRSLNGTVTAVQKLDKGNDVFFGLCLDYSDGERDRFWDHEFSGPVVASMAGMPRDKCVEFCKEIPPPEAGSKVDKKSHHHNLTKGLFRRASRTKQQNEKTAKPVIFSWRTDNQMDVDAQTGRCECISVLHSVRLSFGSFAGFLI